MKIATPSHTKRNSCVHLSCDVNTVTAICTSTMGGDTSVVALSCRTGWDGLNEVIHPAWWLEAIRNRQHVIGCIRKYAHPHTLNGTHVRISMHCDINTVTAICTSIKGADRSVVALSCHSGWDGLNEAIHPA